jgi:spore coat protein A
VLIRAIALVTTRRRFITAGLGATAGALLMRDNQEAAARLARAVGGNGPVPLPGATIPKYIEPLPTFTTSRVQGAALTVEMQEFQQRVLPSHVYAGLPAPYSAGTYLWGYKVGPRAPQYPGCTVEARSGIPTTIRYVNNLPLAALESQLGRRLTIDQTIHWADPLGAMAMGTREAYSGPIPAVPHLHGAEVQSSSDGHPEAWFTSDGKHGPVYGTVSATAANAAVFRYPNSQQATTLWFHDHTLGMTRINVYAGLAAFYLLRDEYDTGLANNPLRLPAGGQEIELVIQDRQFDSNGQLLVPNGTPAANPTGLDGPPANPLIHPYWISEFFGDVMVVNGKSWPYLEVEPRRYRFRVLNGCNARFLRMYLGALVGTVGHSTGPDIWQIGTDGGLLDRPVRLVDPLTGGFQDLFLAPAERADVIIDFAGLAGQQFTLFNFAAAPYPGPAPSEKNEQVVPSTRLTEVMQFRVTRPLTSRDTTYNPATGGALRGGRAQPPVLVRLADAASGKPAAGVTLAVSRQLVLVEAEGTGGPIEALLNNTKWDGQREGTAGAVSGARQLPAALQGAPYVTESPRLGTTELWEIINLTEDAHPIHIHLIQFQVLNRQNVNVTYGYRTAYDASFPGGQFAGLLADGTWGQVSYEPGTYIPGYGPPRPYLTPNARGSLGGNPDVTPYLLGTPALPSPEEAGWKDTVRVLPKQVMRLVVRWAPTLTPPSGASAGHNSFPFDAMQGPGYVWHCHVLDHEDNEMMRPYAPVP